mgnify:CR=1 FL=1
MLRSARSRSLCSLPIASKWLKKTADPSNCSYARYDIDQTETRDLFVGCARKLEVYAYQNGELVHPGNIYNPNAPGVYTYGGFGTGAGGGAFFAINEENELQIAPRGAYELSCIRPAIHLSGQ